MKAKTIGQYAILKWLDNEFVAGSLEIDFTGPNEATIRDINGDTAKVRFVKETGVVYLE